MRKSYFLSIIFILIPWLCGMAQGPGEPEKPKPVTRILFVFDASQSMYGRWQSDTKFNIAVRLFSDMLDSLKNQPNLELALRMYGHQKQFPPQDCNDTRLEVPFGKNNITRIKHVLKTTIPKGTTPIAYSLSQATKDFTPCSNCRNIVILITDGLEECWGDPCAVSLELTTGSGYTRWLRPRRWSSGSSDTGDSGFHS